MYKKSYYIVVLLMLVSSCKNDSKKNQLINDYLAKVIKENEIPDFGIAIIKNGKVAYQRNYSDQFDRNTLEKEQIFPIYSVTKLITTTAVFQLLEEGKLKLKDTIGMYLKGLPNNWQELEIVHLLTHSSGLPNFSFKDALLTDSILNKRLYKTPLHYNKGEYYQYNQTNYWLLSQIIEKVSGKTFEDFIKQKQFEGIDNKLIVSSNFKKRISNRVIRYFYIDELKRYKQVGLDFGERSKACNGISLTLQALIEWNRRLDENLLLSKNIKELMWKTFEYSNSEHVFLHGWKLYNNKNTVSYGLTGGLQVGFRKFVNNDLTIMVLTNGFKHTPIHDSIIEEVYRIMELEIS